MGESEFTEDLGGLSCITTRLADRELGAMQTIRARAFLPAPRGDPLAHAGPSALRPAGE